jgi:hypothetical protein
VIRTACRVLIHDVEHDEAGRSPAFHRHDDYFDKITLDIPRVRVLLLIISHDTELVF